MKALHLPNTVIVGAAAGGTQQNLLLTVQGLGWALLLSVILVYLLMVALYDAYRAPFVIMFAVPVAAIGAFGFLAITHQGLNLYSIIGVVMLVGLVSKNGILLVDFAGQRVRAGIDKVDRDRRSGPRALPPDRNDDGLDDRRDDAAGARVRSGLGRETLARHGRDRRFDQFAFAHADTRADRVHLDRTGTAAEDGAG